MEQTPPGVGKTLTTSIWVADLAATVDGGKRKELNYSTSSQGRHVPYIYAGKVLSQKFLKVLHGKQLIIQATAAEDAENAPSGGKAPVITGPPVGQCSDKQAKPVRHKPKGKRVHNLSLNITKGQNNAGKW